MSEGRKAEEAADAELERARQGFAAWREHPERGRRLPEDLWVLASSLAKRIGISRTSAELRLNSNTLKRRMGEDSADQATFVELSGVLPSSGIACNLSVEVDGVRAELRFDSVRPAELATLLRQLGAK